MFERNRIAETLRSAREERGLSLEQAAATAGIPLQYVRLLEGESNVRVGISDELYLIPFFRKYARFVGLDAEELLPEFLGVVQQLPGEGSPPIRLAYRPRWTFLWKPVAVLATIGIAVVLLLRPSHERPGFEPLASESPMVATEVTAPAAATPATVPATSTPSSNVGIPGAGGGASKTSTPSVTPAASPISGGSHELKIIAKEEAWLSLALNDQPAKQYLLRPEESRTWHADHFALTVGNAGGVTLALDGRDLPPIGRPGQVVRNLRLPSVETPAPSASPAEG